jgi:hypothetical protein
MNPRFIIFIITIALAVNVYYDNKFVLQFKKYQKYYKIGLILVSGLGLSVLTKKNPGQSLDTLQSFNSLINTTPMNKQAPQYLAPLFEKTQPMNMNSIKRLHKPTKKSKRSVSETKKKYVASLQNWRCKHCQNQLSAWFEVDHVQGLEFGGSNDVDNLQALCRECHAKKGSVNKLI